MKEIRYTITDREGIHARPAGELVKAARAFTSSVTVKKGEKQADAKKILGLMSLGVKGGEDIVLQIEGTDEDEASVKLSEFLKANL